MMKKLCMEPVDRVASLQTLWENNKPAEPGPCGKNNAVVIRISSLFKHYLCSQTFSCCPLSLSLQVGSLRCTGVFAIGLACLIKKRCSGSVSAHGGPLVLWCCKKKKKPSHGNFLFDHQDVDTIYLTQDTRELNLQDFSHLENRCVSAVTGLRTASYL